MFIRGFALNGYKWRVEFVNPYSSKLIDRTNKLTVATTDPGTMTVYLSYSLKGSFLTRVFLHELGHCAMFSYGLTVQLHKMVKPEYWVDAEEWVCNFIADYGMEIFEVASNVLGSKALRYVPYALDRLIA